MSLSVNKAGVLQFIGAKEQYEENIYEPLNQYDTQESYQNQIYYNNNVNNVNNVNNINNINNTISKTFFTVKADLAADNYHLYTSENTLYDTALVPTYKCSVLLNALFRNIKENANLDLLEESDDEEEFENTQIDKFVDLEKTVIMECVYSKRFKKWQPLKTAPPNSKIISAKELMQFNYKK
jgi:hypothetical protein